MATKNIIYSTQDANGTLEVADEIDTRVLYFGSDSQQSRMDITAPFALVTEYERVMACWQLFNPEKNGEVLVIGLGGGSATKYCLQHLPDHLITVVELREAVVNVAREYFFLPIDSRLTICIDEGMHYVAQQVQIHTGDLSLMLIDVYDHEKIDARLCSADFFENCLRLLSNDGMLVMNLWGDHQPFFEQVIANIGRTFGWKILLVPVPQSGNIIVFAFHPNVPRYRLIDLQKRAQLLEQSSSIAWTQYLDILVNNNQQLLRFSVE